MGISIYPSIYPMGIYPMGYIHRYTQWVYNIKINIPNGYINIPIKISNGYINDHMIKIDNKMIAIPKISNDDLPVQNLSCTHLLLPSSVTALSRIKDLPDPKSRDDVIHSIHTIPGDLDFENFAAGALEHQTKKIFDCTVSHIAPRGTILNDQRQIALSKPFVHTAKIKGTDEYYDRLERDLKFTIFQEGNIYLKVAADIPKKTDTCLATALM